MPFRARVSPASATSGAALAFAAGFAAFCPLSALAEALALGLSTTVS
jgi:hypothetical protein